MFDTLTSWENLLLAWRNASRGKRSQPNVAAFEHRLESLRLTVHRGSHPRPVTEGIPFLGFVTFPQKCRLKRRKNIEFRRHLRAAVASYEAGELPAGRLAASVQGWLAHTRYGNTAGLRQEMLNNIPSEILGLIEPAIRK